MPALLVCGDRETRFRPHREHVEANMLFLEVVRADGDVVNVEAAESFDAAVVDFLRRHVPR